MPLDTSKPLSIHALKLSLSLVSSDLQEVATVKVVYTKEELQAIPLSTLGSALQRVIYEMLERAIHELPSESG